jgi:predicted nucleotidyltransferase
MKITADQKKDIAKIAEKNGFKLVVLFGSRATGEANEKSDYDIAILSGEMNIFDDIHRFSRCLSDFAILLGTNEDKIDLTNFNKANILLRHEALSGGELLYGDRNLFDEHQAFAFREFHDARKLFELENFLIQKRQNFLAQNF